MRRGSVWIASGKGVYSAKPRPVLIVQSNLFQGTSSLTICPITSNELEAGFARVELRVSAGSGLRQISWVMIDKTTTIARASLAQEIGELSIDDLVAVNRALRVFLDLG